MALASNVVEAVYTKNAALLWDPSLFGRLGTYVYGAAVVVFVRLLYAVFHVESAARTAKRVMKARGQGRRGFGEFPVMNDKERDQNFRPCRFTKMDQEKKDGIPVRAVYGQEKGAGNQPGLPHARAGNRLYGQRQDHHLYQSHDPDSGRFGGRVLHDLHGP